ncbi:hypothetical protein F5144DRAFT_553264 [Chaetomium tenue]|uniref:Uncharacterized protein n=1 Tax=Chaetomium tenue TaxID=1854479 RepID=A0ACB7PQE0_9PEZI|nr:hypothetical protein F5144DRAFT_553264 [Chaetomium globosum]
MDPYDGYAIDKLESRPHDALANCKKYTPGRRRSPDFIFFGDEGKKPIITEYPTVRRIYATCNSALL